MAEGITVKKEDDMSEWYSQVVLKSDLADHAPVKGCYIIKPRGFFIWEKVQEYFNQRLKIHGVKNAYFPLFIPEDFFHKEAKHAKGFSPEVAWIDSKLTGKENRLAIRPTSETIMYDSYSKWIRSYKDLPLKINQWANVVRWETEATKLFLRSREFLWQEGHNAYETEKECDKDTYNYIEEYRKLSEELLAMPVLIGKKTKNETFAGAEFTLTIESFMPDGKALQCGTSHMLGQGFAKSFNIEFLGRNEKKENPWQNSWGFSTRLIGGIVMLHSDDKGLILPPKVAENKLAIIPIIFEKTKKEVIKKCKELEKSLKQFSPILDIREEYSPGWKYNEYELQGIPLRLELGPRDLEKGHVVVVRRDTGKKEFIKFDKLKLKIESLLDEIQDNLFQTAKQNLEQSIVNTKSLSDMIKQIKNKKMVKAHFCNEIKCETSLKTKTEGITPRLISLEEDVKENSKCIICQKKANVIVYFSRSY